MEESGKKDEDDDSSSKVDKKNGDVPKEKRSRKHKHKKHSKSKSKDKKKHRKRKHKSRSRSRSISRSRSRSRSNGSSRRSKSPLTPEEIEHDFVLEKEKTPETVDGNGAKSDTQEDDFYGTDGTVCLSKAASEEKPNDQKVCESKTLDGKDTELGSSVQNVCSDKDEGRLDTMSTPAKEEKDRSRSRSRSEGGTNNLKRKKSVSYSRSRSKSLDTKSSRSIKKRHSRSHSRDRKTKGRSRSSSKESLHKKKSRSRSHSKNKSSKRKSKSRSKERHRKRSLSKSRSRSRSKSRSRSPRRSRSRSPRRRRSRSRSRRKSPVFRNNFRRFSPRWKRGVGSFRRRWSRSRSRSRRSRSRRRSSSRRRQSRSRSRGRRSRSRSRSLLRSRRSRSISRERRRKRSRSKSRSYSRDRKRSRSKSRTRSKSKEKTQPGNTLPASSAAVVTKVSSLIDKPVSSDLSTQQVKVAQRAGGKTIAELTEFCKKLQEEKESVGNDGAGAAAKTEEDNLQPVAHHPFLVKEKPDITIPPVIFPVNKPLVPTVDPNKPLQEQFPVSCGSRHREKEDVSDGASVVTDVDGSAIQTQPKVEVFAPPPAEKFDISELVAKRMESQRRLQSNPNDIEALLTLQEIQMKMQNWCQSNVKPGQFTGELVKNLLPKENLQGGFQAWAKKDMFHNLTPLSGGIGMKLLQKMGWKPGQVIGKRGEGYAEPIALTVKIDRKGLSAGKEKAAKKGASAVLDLQGKHPVSALAEYCSKRKWQLPDYSLVFDHGPAHHKQFLFKVLVNSVEYQPAVVCGNKKQAKANAAIYALKGLGLIPEDADISAL
ncbi:hypothetical protein ACROYT_G020661 [Oculina patagonica]